MSFNRKSLPWLLLALLLVGGLGAAEDWYGRFEYYGDSISYLEMAKAVTHGDWALALNPYWSIGYPLIIAATRWMFPSGPAGEWTAIHAVSLLIFLVAYAGFLRLLNLSLAYLAKVSGVEMTGSGAGFVFAVGTSVFLLLQLLMKNVSQINPDLFVSGIFFLATAEGLEFALRPRPLTALRLGLLMGFGYILKAVFLPLSGILVLVASLHVLTRPAEERVTTFRKLAWCLPAFAVLAIPYVVALSVNVGFFTLGEAGALNYAWSVNHLPSWTNWQGGPAPSGQPMHPTQMLLTDPHVFAYPEPFHVTYPPWYNPFYWYEGYHRYFNFMHQLAAWKYNFFFLVHFLLRGPKGLVAVGMIVAAFFLIDERKVWWQRLLKLWPVYLPSILAIGMYLCVIIEPRYLVAFLIILLTTPFIALFAPTRLVAKEAAWVVVGMAVLGCGDFLAGTQHEVLHRIFHRESYADGEQWQAGRYLVQSGVTPGEKVALVRPIASPNCTWAYVSGVHIVAEIGDNVVAPQDQQEEFFIFTHSPECQQTVFNLFRQAGAVLVVVLDVGDGGIEGDGWDQVPGTHTWIHRL